MRKLIRYFLVVVASVLALLAAAATAAYVSSSRRLSRHYDIPIPAGSVPTVTGAASRGEHLAATRGCMDCHGADLGGAKVVDNPAVGRLYGPNLTRGEGSVVQGYTDEDWARSIRHGVNRQGRGLFLMPSQEYAEWTDQDFADLLAFVKSVPPVNRATVPVSPGPVSRVLMVAGKVNLAAETIDHSGVKSATVSPAATAEYGRYLAVGCQGCHGANFSGGKIASGPPEWPPASNLTPDEHGALRAWTENDFFAALRTGKRPNGSELNAAMPRAFGKMNDDELKALWAFLQTVPAVPTAQR